MPCILLKEPQATQYLLASSPTISTLIIPALAVSQSEGQSIRTALGSGTVTAQLNPLHARDSSFDTGVVIHEYGHGVSNRLTGGPGNAGCLSTTEASGMGEGWSDFLALALTAKSSIQP